MYQKLLFIFISAILLSCESNKSGKIPKEIVNQEQNLEHKSIHQEEWEKYSQSKSEDSEQNYKIEIDTVIVLTINENGNFTNPQFSKNGKKLFFTLIDFNQIWFYNFNENKLEKLIEMPSCGADFKVSDSGDEIFFINKTSQQKNRLSAFSILKYSSIDKKIEVIFSSTKRITSLNVLEDEIYFLENGEAKHINLSTGKIDGNLRIPFYYVENNYLIKVTSVKDTIMFENRNFEFVNVNYSYDFKTINTLTKHNGIILFDINGKPLNVFSKANYLNSLYQSNLLLFTEEKDDYDRILESKLKIGFVNSNITLDVNSDKNEFYYNPVWSPTENKIAYSSQDGIIKLISFNIEKISK